MNYKFVYKEVETIFLHVHKQNDKTAIHQNLPNILIVEIIIYKEPVVFRFDGWI